MLNGSLVAFDLDPHDKNVIDLLEKTKKEQEAVLKLKELDYVLLDQTIVNI